VWDESERIGDGERTLEAVSSESKMALTLPGIYAGNNLPALKPVVIEFAVAE
jgi:hypothetical protein